MRCSICEHKGVEGRTRYSWWIILQSKNERAFFDSGSISFFFSLYTSSFYRKAVSVLVSFSQFDRSIGQGVTIEFLFAPNIFLHLTKIICTSYCNAKLYFLASWTILSWIASHRRIYKMNANTSQSKWSLLECIETYSSSAEVDHEKGVISKIPQRSIW